MESKPNEYQQPIAEVTIHTDHNPRCTQQQNIPLFLFQPCLVLFGSDYYCARYHIFYGLFTRSIMVGFFIYELLDYAILSAILGDRHLSDITGGRRLKVGWIPPSIWAFCPYGGYGTP